MFAGGAVLEQIIAALVWGEVLVVVFAGADVPARPALIRDTITQHRLPRHVDPEELGQVFLILGHRLSIQRQAHTQAFAKGR